MPAIDAAAQALYNEPLFVVREFNVSRKDFTAITKPTLSDILLNRVSCCTDMPCLSEYAYVTEITIRSLLLGIANNDPKYVSVLDDVKRAMESDQPDHFLKQYKNRIEIVKGYIDHVRVSTTLDMLMLLYSMNKLTPQVCEYLLEIEYGTKQVDMVELLNMTCTKQ